MLEKPTDQPVCIKADLKGLWFRHRFRYFVLLLGFFCTTSISANMGVFNFTVICMFSLALNSSTQEPTLLMSMPENAYSIPKVYAYSEYQKNLMMWSLATGTLLSTLPFSWLYTQYGARYVLFGAALLSATATALFPFAAVHLSFGVLLFLRFLQGVGYAADFAAMGMLCSKWASLTQYGLFLSVVSSYSPASSLITNSVSSVFCTSHYGWPAVYYSFSVATVVIALLWLYFYNDQPHSNPFVSSLELERINRGKTLAHVMTSKFVPYKQIMQNKVVWVVWLNAFADLCSGVFILMYQPQYFNFALHYNISQTGFLTSMPTLAHVPLKIISGIASDKISCLSETTKMIICNWLSVGVPGLLYLGIAFSPSPFFSFLGFLLVAVFFAPAGGGFYKCAMFSSRQYSHFVMANIQINKCIAMFLSPALMAAFVKDVSEPGQWRIIFIIFGVLCLVANILFCFTATDQPEEFTKITSSRRKK